MKNQGKASNSGVVVIVVSDDLAVRNSLKFWLEIEGLTVRGYVSGADLLDAGTWHAAIVTWSTKKCPR